VAALKLYGTGIRGRGTLASVTCTIGGVAARVLYAGPQGGFAGLDQVNVVLPRSLSGSGLVSVQLSVDGLAANPVEVNIRQRPVVEATGARARRNSRRSVN
jgi:uncharacterized protein (TIGR03437 family)